jgi:hypothetical protein
LARCREKRSKSSGGVAARVEGEGGDGSGRIVRGGSDGSGVAVARVYVDGEEGVMANEYNWPFAKLFNCEVGQYCMSSSLLRRL